MAWKLLPTNYTDAIWSGLRKYNEIANDDGTVSFDDVTIYTNKEKSFFGAKEANRMNEALNILMSMVENGTNIYEDFLNYFNTQKVLFEQQANTVIEQIQADYVANITQFEHEQEIAFTTWFDTIKGQLSTDAAGKLQQEIDALTISLNGHKESSVPSESGVHGLRYFNKTLQTNINGEWVNVTSDKIDAKTVQLSPETADKFGENPLNVDKAIGIVYDKAGSGNMSSYLAFCGNVNGEMVTAAFGKSNDDMITNFGNQLAAYGWYKGDVRDTMPFVELRKCDTYTSCFKSISPVIEMIHSTNVMTLVDNNVYAKEIFDTNFDRLTSAIIRNGQLDMILADEILSQRVFARSVNTDIIVADNSCLVAMYNLSRDNPTLYEKLMTSEFKTSARAVSSVNKLGEYTSYTIQFGKYQTCLFTVLVLTHQSSKVGPTYRYGFDTTQGRQNYDIYAGKYDTRAWDIFDMTTSNILYSPGSDRYSIDAHFIPITL